MCRKPQAQWPGLVKDQVVSLTPWPIDTNVLLFALLAVDTTQALEDASFSSHFPDATGKGPSQAMGQEHPGHDWTP